MTLLKQIMIMLMQKILVNKLLTLRKNVDCLVLKQYVCSKWLANNFLKYLSFQGNIDFNVNSKKTLMD